MLHRMYHFVAYVMPENQFRYSYILINNAVNNCLRIKQACVCSAILAVLIQIMHEGRLISNTNAYEGK